MKILACIVIIAAGLILSLTAFVRPWHRQAHTTAEMTPAIVELFTSEGCSSCPPADALLAKLAEKYKSKIVVLSFHVDYWNKLGWRDPYSSEINTRRQYEYAKFFPGDGVYTPQAIVNGSQQTVGSNEQGLNDQLNKFANNSVATKIMVHPALQKNSNVIQVTYKFEGAATDVLNIAILQKTGSSLVNAGENKGERLNHVNIVRGFKTVKNTDSVVQFEMPGGVNAHDVAVVAYTQDPQTMKITGATRMMDLPQQ